MEEAWKMGGDEVHLQGLGPEKVSSARGRRGRVCRTGYVLTWGFSTQLSISAYMCLQQRHILHFCLLVFRTYFQFSSLPIKHQLNRFWTKFQFCWKRLKSIEEENRRPWLKLFFILEWIIVLEGTSQWLIQQEETAFHYQLKGVSPLHLKQLISAAVRETSGIAQCGSSYPEKQTYPALYRKAEVCSCLQWQVDYVVCKQLYFMVLGKM